MTVTYDFETLEEWCRDHIQGWGDPGYLGGINDLSSADRQLYYRGKSAGILRTHQADRLAIALDALPSEIWNTYAGDAIDERRCAWCREGSSAAFCSQVCRGRLRAGRVSNRRRMKIWQRTIDETTERVAVMDLDELRAFLGIDLIEERKAA